MTTASHPGANAPASQKSCERPVLDLATIPTVPFAMVDEHIYATIRGCSIKTVQRERQEGIGCRFRKINGKSVRYKIGDIFEFLEAQPTGGGGTTPHDQRRQDRPRRLA